MRRNRKFLYSKKDVRKIAISKEILFFSLLLISGILIGVFIARNGNDTVITQVKSIFDSFYSIRENQSIISSVSNSLKVYIVFWMINLFFGFCIIGAPFIAGIPIIRGLGIGLVSGYIYSIYGLKGIGYCMIVIFPGALISFIALIYAVIDSFRMSVYSFGAILNNGNRKNGSEKIKIYLIRQMVYLFLFIAAAFADGTANKLFSGIFSF